MQVLTSHRQLRDSRQGTWDDEVLNIPVAIRRCIKSRTIQHLGMVLQHSIQPGFEVVDPPDVISHAVPQ